MSARRVKGSRVLAVSRVAKLRIMVDFMGFHKILKFVFVSVMLGILIKKLESALTALLTQANYHSNYSSISIHIHFRIYAAIVQSDNHNWNKRQRPSII
jgi:hypothetical protein